LAASERKGAIESDLHSARAEFHRVFDHLTDDDLERTSANPGWTNGQIAWHITFGFVLALTLVPLAELFAGLPRSVSRGFAAILNWTTPVFNLVNRLGPRGGARVHSRKSIVRTFDRVLNRLTKMADSMDERRLSRGMYYPQRWDPNSFSDYMTVEMIFRYPVAHMRHHIEQVR
jgi:DinB family protein